MIEFILKRELIPFIIIIITVLIIILITGILVYKEVKGGKNDKKSK